MLSLRCPGKALFCSALFRCFSIEDKVKRGMTADEINRFLSTDMYFLAKIFSVLLTENT